MTLVDLKKQVDYAIEMAKDFEADADEIVVSLQLDGPDESVYSSDNIGLHYDNNGYASGCVLTAWLEKA